jgi:tetratricopeptide (TPR) repeat protein
MTKTLSNQSKWKETWFLALALVVVTFAAYQSAWHAGFIWDDDDHLTANPVMTAPHGLQEIWSSMAASRYYPLTLTNFWLQRRLWGLNPLPYHLVNIAFHAINGVLVFLVLRRLRLRAAWWAALLWAVHPVNVESAAWVTEMKNTQSGLFFFLALLCVLQFESAESPRQDAYWRWYVLSLLCGAAAMLSKPSTVVLPFVLLLCAWWERGRLRPKDIARAVPFFAMALAMSLWAISEQQHHVRASGTSESTLGSAERLIVAGRAVWFYAAKVLWPANLIFVYPRWDLKASSIVDWLPLTGAVALGTMLWRQRRQSWAKACLFGFGFFLIALLPVLGFFDIYYFRYSFVADHFQYLASLGLIALAASGIPWVLGRWRMWPERAGNAVGLGLALTLGVLTWRQARMYSDIETLFRRTIQQNPNCSMPHNNLGVILLNDGKIQDAMGQFEEALRANPDSFEADNNLGTALFKLGKTQDAIAHFEKALKVNPHYFQAHSNLGDALLKEGQTPKGIKHLQEALRINPYFAEAHNSLGNALFAGGKVKEAITQYQLALQIKPKFAEAQNNLGVALVYFGKPEDAIRQFEEALRIKPDSAEAHRNWGHALEQMGKVPEAIGHYQQTLQIKPDYAEAHNDLGNALMHVGSVRGALEHFEQALRIKPDSADVQNNLAWALATVPPSQGGDPGRAVTLAERACKLTDHKAAPYLDTLATAYAAVGRFNDATVNAQKAVELARATGQPQLVAEIEAHLQLYRNGQPYRPDAL